MTDRVDAYETFREMIDAHPSGAPKSEAFAKILRMLFGPEEIEIAVRLSFKPKSAAEIAGVLAISEERAAELLEILAARSVINSREKDGTLLYSLLPTVPGIFEIPFMKGGGTPWHEELGRLWDEYNREVMIQSLCGEPTPQMRVIPVQRSMEPQSRVYARPEIERLVGESDRIAVAHCACRVSRNACSSPREVCLVFGALAEAVVQRGHARSVSRDEALEILRAADEAGLVHTSNNSADRPGIICSCCRCCCHFLRGIIEKKNSAAVSPSPYEASVNPEKCSSCGICAGERCPVGAIRVEGNAAVVDRTVCIGCGLCVSACPESAMELVPRDNAPAIPATSRDMLGKMLVEKGRVERFMKLLA